MKKLDLIILSIYSSLLFLLLFDGLYYLDFSPFNIVKSINLQIHNFFISFCISLLIIWFCFIVLGFIFNRYAKLISRRIYYYIYIGIIYFLLNLILKFSCQNIILNNILCQISIFCVLIIVFNTFFYSIFFSNLLEYKSMNRRCEYD